MYPSPTTTTHVYFVITLTPFHGFHESNCRNADKSRIFDHLHLFNDFSSLNFLLPAHGCNTPNSRQMVVVIIDLIFFSSSWKLCKDVKEN